MDADLVVMGPFTHSRLREMVLGGVTQQMLELLARAAFMAQQQISCRRGRAAIPPLAATVITGYTDRRKAECSSAW